MIFLSFGIGDYRDIKISHSSKEKDNVIFDLKYLFWRFVQKGRISSMMCRQTGNREMSNRTGENGAEVTKGDGERKREGDTSLHIFLCHSGRGDALLSRDKSKCGGKIAGKRRGAGFRGVRDECREGWKEWERIGRMGRKERKREWETE